jgi:hypothetical protein
MCYARSDGEEFGRGDWAKDMNSINRAAIVVRPKGPFYAWAESLEGGRPAEMPSADELSSVYLADADEGDAPEDVVRRNYAAIIEEQLDGWHRNPDDWPTKRTYAMFEQWFEARVVDLVFDLGDGPIAHDE